MARACAHTEPTSCVVSKSSLCRHSHRWIQTDLHTHSLHPSVRVLYFLPSMSFQLSHVPVCWAGLGVLSCFSFILLVGACLRPVTAVKLSSCRGGTLWNRSCPDLIWVHSGCRWRGKDVRRGCEPRPETLCRSAHLVVNFFSLWKSKPIETHQRTIQGLWHFDRCQITSDNVNSLNMNVSKWPLRFALRCQHNIDILSTLQSCELTYPRRHRATLAFNQSGCLCN